MPPGMTQESCRPRVSDRTMVGNSATRSACEFQRTEGAVISANMKRRQGGKSIQGPLFRGLTGRSATGRNDQAAAEEMWLRELGAGCRKNIPAVPVGRSVFHLTSPLIGCLWLHRFALGFSLQQAQQGIGMRGRQHLLATQITDHAMARTAGIPLGLDQADIFVDGAVWTPYANRKTGVPLLSPWGLRIGGPAKCANMR